MKYMLLIYAKEDVWTESERVECMEESRQLCHELNSKGQFIAASPLHSVNTATSVRMREGKRLLTDGPFAETHEQLGGYFIVDVSDLDAAIAIASRLPGGRRGTIEIRPIFELEEMP